MALGPQELAKIVGDFLAPIFNTIGWAIQLIVIIAVLYWFYTLWTFDTKILISEIGKKGRVINSQTRAKEFIDKKTKIPKLRLFGKLGFMGEVIELPPSECIIPYKSRLTNKMYMYVKKDGLYWPIQNLVLGKRQTIDNKEIFTLDGSGLEVSRDYNSEDAILNRLENAAHKYRNKDQRNQIYLGYGIMIMGMIIAGIIMIYTINKIGGLEAAIQALREPIKEAVSGALQQKIGPG